MVGEHAARHVSDVQLDARLVALRAGRICHAVAAAVPIFEDELDVLPSAVLQRIVGRQLKLQHGHVVARFAERRHTARHLAHGKFARAGHGARFEHHVGLRRGAAGEGVASLFFGWAQGLGLVGAVDHAAFDQLALARAASAVAATVRQAHTLADGSREDGLVAVDGETHAAGQHGHGERHRITSVSTFANQPAILPARSMTLQASLPTRFKRPTLLIVGCGDVGMRVVRLLRGRWRLLALTSSPQRAPVLREAGVVPLIGNLDQPATLARLAGMADAVLHLAPPLGQGESDTRTRHLLQALARKGRVRRIVYASTSGVYGDAQGARFDETRAVNPTTDRARRRVDAEARVRWYGRALGASVSVLRIPGIYAGDRPGGHPRERLARGTPVLAAGDDVFTNHIHADDLARACVAALHRGLPQRVFHTSDDTELTMGDYFDLAADLCGLPRPPRITRQKASEQMSAVQQSFMSESRRLDNTRLKRELRLKLSYPTVNEGLLA
ncbi:MAG: SDR family oxidoreductase [Rhizobacter sp.]|nr:SDR family oxidoreductase [Rhizobacter sp.]